MAGKDSATAADTGSTSDTRDPSAPAISESDMPAYMDQDQAAALLEGSIESLLNLGGGDDDRPDDDQDDDQSDAGDDTEDDEDVDDDQASEQSDDDEDDEEEDDDNAEDDDQGEDQSDDDSEVESASGLFIRDDKGKLKGADPADIELDLTIDGEQQTMSLAELRDGYMRTDDYTRKTQEFSQRVAEEVQTELTDAHAKLDERTKEFDVIVETFTGLASQPPNFQQILAQHGGDAEAAGRHFDQINALRGRLAEVRKAIDERETRKSTQEQKALADNAERTLKILKESVPEWKDPKAFKKEETEITAYMGEMGITQQELVQIMQNVKFANALRDAVYGRKMRDKKPAVRRKRQVAAKRTKRTATGKPSTSRKNVDRAQVRKQARQGDEKAALTLIEGLL